MSIRSTAKAIIIKSDQVLLNRSYDERHGSYYTLPGGGQKQYEELEQALKRECLEETGYHVYPIRYAAISEEISLDPYIRENYNEYSHRMYHIFICELESCIQEEPVSQDRMQIGTEWVDIAALNDLTIYPKLVEKNICDIIAGEAPVFLGSEVSEHYHA